MLSQNLNFLWKFGVLTCGIRAQGSNTRSWWSPTSFYETVIWIIMLMYFLINVFQQRNCFWSLKNRYGNDGGICRRWISIYWTRKLTKRPYTRRSNHQFLITVTNSKRPKIWNGICKMREWKDSEGSGGAKSDLNRKDSNWG